jgi:hypothetical protein
MNIITARFGEYDKALEQVIVKLPNELSFYKILPEGDYTDKKMIIKGEFVSPRKLKIISYTILNS